MREQPQLIRPPSLTDAVVMHIRDAIIHGEYAPGQQLAEASLAQTLGTSRGTVREAMRVLANLGLVARSANRGPIVTLLTPQKAREIYTLRALLESFAARTAAETGRLDSTALEDLEAHHHALADAGRTGNVSAMVEADMQFHWALSALAGHELLLEHLADIQTHNRRLLAYSDLYRPASEIVLQRHQQLLDTLRAGDPDVIERAIHEHISEVGLDIVERMMLRATGGVTGDGVGDRPGAEENGRAPADRALGATERRAAPTAATS